MFRKVDIEIIDEKIKEIENISKDTYLTNYEPTYEESNKIYQVIIDFIKSKSRLIYGGYAQDQLIKIKNTKDTFYEKWDIPDIEFYSYEIIEDSVNLSNILFQNNFKHIQAKSGPHEGTIKLFVNFVNYCDITFLPKHIYDKCKYYEDRTTGLRYPHPYFLYIDFYRVFTDPMTSYWRLSKSFSRFNKLIKYYPFNKPDDTNIIIDENEFANIIRKKIIHNSKLINIGIYAYNYYIKKIKQNTIKINYYEVISTNYKEDVSKIYEILNKLFPKKITKNKYVPFFQFFDERTEFLYNDQVIFKIYNNNEICIQNRFSKNKKCYFASCSTVFLYLLSNYNYYIINKNQVYSNNYYNMLYNLNEGKNKYLDKHKITVMDKSPFQDFTMECFGYTIDFKRKGFLHKSKNRFNYEPEKYKNNLKSYKILKLKYPNCSGNKII